LAAEKNTTPTPQGQPPQQRRYKQGKRREENNPHMHLLLTKNLHNNIIK
jgi:hypothetical protein